MTEEEWLTDFAPGPMLEFVCGRASERKLRLLGCACLRRVCHVLNDRNALGTIVRVEEYADGLRTRQSVRQAIQTGRWAIWDDLAGIRIRLVATALAGVAGVSLGQTIPRSIEEALSNARCVGDDGEPAAQADLIREVFGNPFRPAHFDASSLTPLAADLAQAAYGERSTPRGELDTARLAILGDALEDAGCADGEILSHLRSSGPHVRGCWALDLILGKR